MHRHRCIVIVHAKDSFTCQRQFMPKTSFQTQFMPDSSYQRQLMPDSSCQRFPAKDSSYQRQLMPDSSCQRQFIPKTDHAKDSSSCQRQFMPKTSFQTVHARQFIPKTVHTKDIHAKDILAKTRNIAACVTCCPCVWCVPGQR